jgi:SAM-dependent methyltransferase
MHKSSRESGACFAKAYAKDGMTIVDVGGKDTKGGGSLRDFFLEKNSKYICVDFEADESVDVIVKPGDKLPFDTGSVDLVVSTSCFEHDPCFWLTFKEMCRIVKLGGFIYINSPSSGRYHTYPGDNWRFYPEAGQALAYWSGIKMGDETVYPGKVKESFFIYNRTWNDFVCVWERVNEIETEITIDGAEIFDKKGNLETLLNEMNWITYSRFFNDYWRHMMGIAPHPGTG